MSIPLRRLRALLLGMLRPPKWPPSCRLHDNAPETSSPPSLFSIWLSSRAFRQPDGASGFLAPGAQRPLSRDHLQLALQILQRCSLQLFTLLWSLHPLRLLVMISLDICRGILPAFRGYSQALIIDEASQLAHDRSDVLR